MTFRLHRLAIVLAALAVPIVLYSCATKPVETATDETDRGIEEHARQMIMQGRKIFRSDTFGSEAFWTKTRLHEAIAGEKNGGVGPGISPNQALKLGLRVDSGAVPRLIVALIQAGTANLDNPEVPLDRR